MLAIRKSPQTMAPPQAERKHIDALIAAASAAAGLPSVQACAHPPLTTDSSTYSLQHPASCLASNIES
jgi:hypothetical protein